MRLRALRRIRPVGDSIDHEYDTHDGRVGQNTHVVVCHPKNVCKSCHSRNLVVDSGMIGKLLATPIVSQRSIALPK